MNKEWKIEEKVSEDFFKEYPKYNRVILQLLYNRNIKSKKDIEMFLEGEYENAFDPFLFRDMEKAVSLVIDHIKNKSKICVYGDYDADGMTAVALLFEVLETLKADVFVYIPDRVSEGYGVNREAIDKIVKNEAKLIITVDTGIRNKEEIDYAISEGVEVVLTDHHPPGEEKDNLPSCLTINPSLDKEPYPFSHLAGVGVSFKLASALIDKSTLERDLKERFKERLLDLVAIGSIADMVTLLGENRILIKKGLETLNNTKRVGLKELIKVSGVEGRELSSWNVGFQIAPRLNASSRIGDAASSFNLLVEKDIKKAEVTALELNDNNIARQNLTVEMVEEVEKQIEAQKDKKLIIGLCPEDKTWSEGIVGLVAGRIADKYYKPTLIITRAEDGFKGSGRSVPEFNLAEAVDDTSEFLGKHGGHPMACAFNLEAKNISKFIEKINSLVSSRLAGVKLAPKISIDLELELNDINMELVKMIISFEPFGKNNKEPIFLSKKVEIKDIMTMGVEGQHIKFKFGYFWAIAFGKSEKFKDFRIGDTVDLVYNININKFNGREDVQFKIVDMRVLESGI